ncbi:MAG: hypothetical protein DRP18_00100 [Candidatus Aenigmatarchaeota archaeon]|nr:MAG: hypothetical protein DRP18_00100 [Candidatus Aenigmarchaeota archaeon]RLJ08249.1 MAG: hypothetical protein DRP16_01785 [Candidatus Aenigmarchaeota archaeon]
MHEFTAVQKAINEILGMEQRPKKVKIILGKIYGNAKNFKDMFREHTRGTPIENIDIEIEQVPVEIKCECGFSGTVKILEHVHFVRCPLCGKVADILKGDELKVEVIE